MHPRVDMAKEHCPVSAPRWVHPVAGWRSGATLSPMHISMTLSGSTGQPSRFRIARLSMAIIMTLLAIGAAFVPNPDRVRAATAVTTADLNMRSGPSTSYSVITVMPAGAYVEVTGNVTNDFYPVYFEGASGFASAQFINMD